MKQSKVIELHPRVEAAPSSRPTTDRGRPGIDPTITAAAEGDANAIHTLVVRILPRVRNLVRYMVRGDDIDDLSQDVVIKILERLPSYRGEGRFESWVDGIAVRVTLRTMSKRRKEQRRAQQMVPEELPDAMTGPVAARYMTRRRAVQILDELPTPQRHALVMHHVLGMTIQEIARELDVPAETVRSRLRVGMGQLRAWLGALRSRNEVRP